jgi:hypothetical protein
MRREAWIRSNRRLLPWLLLLPLVTCVGGASLVWGGDGVGWQLVGGGLLFAGVLLTLAIGVAQLEPRLAYHAGMLSVNLGPGRPTLVPIDRVECFFLGHVDVSSARGQRTRSSTVVVRLAESAVDWKHRPVLPLLGRWCDGYIVLYGLWCEPLNGAFVEALNQRLVAVRRQARQTAEEPMGTKGREMP